MDVGLLVEAAVAHRSVLGARKERVASVPCVAEIAITLVCCLVTYRLRAKPLPCAKARGMLMARGETWSIVEVEACVADYLDMLTLELNGQAYNKSQHRRTLLHKLDERSEASVEQKHRNISAVMKQLGYPPLRGYKPLANFQHLLIEVVEAQLALRPALDAAARAAVEQPAVLPTLLELQKACVPAPKAKRVAEKKAPEYVPRFSPVQRDYLAVEARNRSLGLAGEEFVVAYEHDMLRRHQRADLAKRVEHVAKTQGDGLGFDVLSFDPVSGEDRLIEVKTTAFDEATPFYVTRNEVARSERDAARYRLYRVFDFRDTPRFFALPGAIPQSCELDPVSWSARPIGQ